MTRTYRERRYLYGRSWVDSTGTRRHIQALAVAGWSLRDLASRSGVSHIALKELSSGKRQYAFRATARAVERLSAELAGQTATGSHVAQLRARALAKGWVPLAAWHDVDDPDETPSAVRDAAPSKRTNAEVVEEYEHLKSFGESDESIAARLGMQVASLHRALGRAA